MGIQLPPELADVAARAGVVWPEADEDKLRASARAWRDAGTKLDGLTRDADHTARTALNAVHGETGDAARRHWSTFVQPDTGHLTATARGCTAAADRLDHAANQVGAAKVEIVRNLVTLAKTTDAANSAAAAGHPNALLGVDTAVRGTAANVAQISTTLERAVQPANGVDVATTAGLVNTNPGAHGNHGQLDPVTNLVGDTGRAVPAVVGDAANVVNSTGSGVPHVVGDTGRAVPAVVGHTTSDATNVVGATGPGATRLVGDLASGGPTLLGDAGPPWPGPAGPATHDLPGNPEVTGPVRIAAADLGPGHHPRPDLPTPPAGQTVQAGFVGGGGFDPALPAQVTPGHAAPPPAGGPLPTSGGAPAAPPGAGPVPGFGAPVGGAP
ncbi:MAG: hypothetical protein ACJ72N_28405, partial [Labedaea sp.]